MLWTIKNIALQPDHTDADLLRAAAFSAGVEQSSIKSLRILRRSIDARKNNVKLIYTAEAELTARPKSADAEPCAAHTEQQRPIFGTKRCDAPVAVIGAGPCGLFAAKTLIENGYSVIMLERGRRISERKGDVREFWTKRILNGDSNALFGEGGAGTFSDGKLTTRIKSPFVSKVISEFIAAGADKDIAVAAHPHIGTDVLQRIIPSLTDSITALGGQAIFGAKLTGLLFSDGWVTSVEYEREGKTEKLPVSAVILAVGHSARDTYEALNAMGMAMEAKPFAVGVRAEHPQNMIDKVQYGEYAGSPRLGHAEYALTARTRDGRGVYTFCMCPGGMVVPSVSEEGHLCVNGMSENSRNAANANAAVVVGVSPDDFGRGVLDGVRFQRDMERAAFIAGGGDYAVPAQLISGFLSRKGGGAASTVKPSYPMGVKWTSLDKVLPDFVSAGIAEGLSAFERRLRGYATAGGVLTGVETRTSSPVRILRTETGQSPTAQGLYPAGEGAGYAGGIVSAACDGIKTAYSVMACFAPHFTR